MASTVMVAVRGMPHERGNLLGVPKKAPEAMGSPGGVSVPSGSSPRRVRLRTPDGNLFPQKLKPPPGKADGRWFREEMSHVDRTRGVPRSRVGQVGQVVIVDLQNAVDQPEAGKDYAADNLHRPEQRPTRLFQ